MEKCGCKITTKSADCKIFCAFSVIITCFRDVCLSFVKRRRRLWDVEAAVVEKPFLDVELNGERRRERVTDGSSYLVAHVVDVLQEAWHGLVASQ